MSNWNWSFEIHVNMFIWLKSYWVKFLEVRLRHLDNGVRMTYSCMFTPQSAHTGLSVLCRIDSPRSEEGSRKENKITISMRGSAHLICTARKASIQGVQHCKVLHVFTFDKKSASRLLTCLVWYKVNQKKVQQKPAERGISPPRGVWHKLGFHHPVFTPILKYRTLFWWWKCQNLKKQKTKTVHVN